MGESNLSVEKMDESKEDFETGTQEIIIPYGKDETQGQSDENFDFKSCQEFKEDKVGSSNESISLKENEKYEIEQKKKQDMEDYPSIIESRPEITISPTSIEKDESKISQSVKKGEGNFNDGKNEENYFQAEKGKEKKLKSETTGTKPISDLSNIDVQEKVKPTSETLEKDGEPLEEDTAKPSITSIKEISSKSEVFESNEKDEESSKKDQTILEEMNTEDVFPQNGDDKEGEATETKEIHFEYKQEILEGAVGIEAIINNLVSLLAVLSKSIDSKNTLSKMKEDLNTLKEASDKVSEQTDQKHIGLNQAVELSNDLQLVIGKVQILTLDMMKINDDLTSSGVKEEELTNLLLNCKKIGSSLNSHILVQDRTKTPPSSPVLAEITQAQEAPVSDPILSLVSHIVTTAETISTKSGDECFIDSSREETVTKVDTIIAKSDESKEEKQEDKTEKKGMFDSLKQKVSSKFSKSEEDIGLKTSETTKAAEPKEELPQSAGAGFLSNIKQKVGGFFSSQSDIKTDDEEIEEDIQEGKKDGTTSPSHLKQRTDDKLEITTPSPMLLAESEVDNQNEEKQKTAISSGNQGNQEVEGLPSLDSTYASGYHFETPPTMSMDSDVQPCGVDGSMSSRTTTTVSEAFSEHTSSSEYKVLTEVSSISSETSSKNVDILKSIEQIDSEDQMSSGTFSVDDSSPRYAELPSKLSNTEENSIVKKVEKDMALDMRSTSITSNASEQEIPPTTPRDELTSPTSMESENFTYEVQTEKLVNDTVDIMSQSIYLSSNEQIEDETGQNSAFSILNSIFDKSEMTSSVMMSKDASDEKEETPEINDDMQEMHSEKNYTKEEDSNVGHGKDISSNVRNDEDSEKKEKFIRTEEKK